MFRLLFILVFAGTTVCAQETVLPYFRDGQWALIDTTGKEVTKTRYGYIHTFDQMQTTFYSLESRYGVMNDQGKELTGNEFDDIVQLGFGKYNVKTANGWNVISFINGTRNDFLLSNDATFQPLSENWLEMNEKGKKSFVNLKTQLTISAPDSLIEHYAWCNYLILSTKDRLIVYSPDGATIVDEGSSAYVQRYETIRIISTPDNILVIDESGLNRFAGADDYEYFDGNLFIHVGGKGTLYDWSTKKMLIEGPYEHISSWTDEFWYVSNFTGRTSNLLSKQTKKPIFPAATSSFFTIPEGGYVIYDVNGLCVAVDKQMRPLIPGKFTSIRFTGNDLAYTYVNEAKGLYSLKTKNYLLPSIYSEITNTKDRYKGIFKDNYSIIQIDKAHKIVNRIDGKNNLYIPTKSLLAKKQFFDPRLFPMGWFVDSSEVITVKDETSTLYRWGLKDQNDSLLLKPLLGNLNYVVGPFAYNKSKARQIDLPDGSQVEASFLQFYTHKTGKQAGPSNVLWCDTLDFMTRIFMRVYTSKGYGFLTETGTFKPAVYMQLDGSPVLRYCYEGGVEPTKDDKDELTTEMQMSLTMARGKLLDAKAVALNRQAAQNRQGYRSKYVKAKWNYLDENGQNLFSEPFEFAFEFVGNHAIAVRDGKWGVVSKDTILIPFSYKHIERIIKGTDTLFMTESQGKGNRFLDTTLTKIPQIQQHLKANSAINIVQISGQQHVWDRNYAELIEPQSSIKLYDKGYFSFKKDKALHLHDSLGNSLCDTKRKIEQVLNDNYFIFEESSRLGVADFTDAEILPAQQESITAYGSLFLVENNSGSHVYSASFQPILSFTEGKLFIDSIQNKIAHNSNNQVTIYNAAGKKMLKLKDLTIEGFHNGALLVKGKTTQIIDLEQKLLKEIPDAEGKMVFPNGWYCIKSDKRGWLLFNENWKEVQPAKLPIRHIYYHGGSTFSFWDKSMLYTVINYENNKQIDGLTAVEGSVTEGSLLVKKPNNAYYVNSSMEPINRFHYLDASPYKNGYAAVKDSRGWTIVDITSTPVSYPSFPKIECLGPNLFSCPQQPVYGLFDSNGKSLIETNYERLKFVKDNIIQGVSQGEISYFDKKGKRII